MRGLIDLTAACLLVVSVLGLLLFFPLYPLAVWVASWFRTKRVPPSSGHRPSVTLLVVVRNAGEFIEEKVRNCLALRYAPERLDIVFHSDGSTDATNRILGSYEGPRLRLLHGAEHQGKIPSLNSAMRHCVGEIVVFSDADARLDPDAVTLLVRHYEDTRIGGVCGRRVIAEQGADLQESQSRYIDFDSTIKILESRIGSITSNDGKLYSIRRELFHPIEPGVTDDLFVALDIVRQGRTFTYEPRARAFIRTPSRGPAHEVERRRRIVAQSLRGIYLLRETLNPFLHGWFSVALIINKVLRRMLPFYLILLFVSSLILCFSLPWIAPVWAMQAGFYALGWSYRWAGPRGALRRLAASPYFFMVGQYGTLLGVFDFVSGRRVIKWDPVKTDAKAH